MEGKGIVSERGRRGPGKRWGLEREIVLLRLDHICVVAIAEFLLLITQLKSMWICFHVPSSPLNQPFIHHCVSSNVICCFVLPIRDGHLRRADSTKRGRRSVYVVHRYNSWKWNGFAKCPSVPVMGSIYLSEFITNSVFHQYWHPHFNCKNRTDVNLQGNSVLATFLEWATFPLSSNLKKQERNIFIQDLIKYTRTSYLIRPPTCFCTFTIFIYVK